MNYFKLSFLMGLLIALGITFLATSCVDNREQPKTVNTSVQSVSSDATIDVVKVGNCQYVRWKSIKRGGITHKGDCSNPIHDWNK